MSQSMTQSSSYASQKATAADLSIFEKLDLLPAVAVSWANAFAAIFTGVFRPKSQRPSSYYRYVNLTFLRTITRRTTARQQHYMTPPTDDAYIAVCKKRNFTPNSEILEDGTRAHWIGSSKAEKLVLNFHGGGYVVPASTAMFEFMFQIVDTLKAQGKDIAVLMLSYDLAPGRPYPRQLQQASALLNHVLLNLNYRPQNILLSGDSAGANLVLSLLSHLSHPHPSTTLRIPAITLSAPLRGAVLISPWVSFNTQTPSFLSNAYKDSLTPTALHSFSTSFLSHQPPDYYNEPLSAPESWWSDMPIDEILIVAGEDEVLIDSIRALDEKLRLALGDQRVKRLVARGEYHDQSSLDLGFGYTEMDEGVQAKKIKSWIGSKL